jgi:hypothetical protein
MNFDANQLAKQLASTFISTPPSTIEPSSPNVPMQAEFELELDPETAPLTLLLSHPLLLHAHLSSLLTSTTETLLQTGLSSTGTSLGYTTEEYAQAFTQIQAQAKKLNV